MDTARGDGEVRLSDSVDAGAIEASHHDGVLEVRIPVREAAQPRKITVGAGEARELPAEPAGSVEPAE
jgi:hypothetical protein